MLMMFREAAEDMDRAVVLCQVGEVVVVKEMVDSIFEAVNRCRCLGLPSTPNVSTVHH